MSHSPVSATIDFDTDGVHHGFLKTPYSGDDSAWGAIMTPISVIRNGDGPTAILTGANHGDEYEGSVALWELTHQLSHNQIKGRVIIIPAMNYPAFRAGKRTSPIDGGNMNRSFPGNPKGTQTEIMADYFNRTLLPMADYVLDLHSGGRTLNFVPFAAAHVLDDKEQQARCVACMQAFAAPYSIMLLELDAGSMYDTAAESQGKVFVSTEIGGGGTATGTSNDIARRGVRNVLIHAGILQGDLVAAKSISLDMPDDKCFVTSEHSGLLAMHVDLGEAVTAGQTIAQVYDVERTGQAPVEYKASIDGIVSGRHHPGLIKPGDAMAVIAIPQE